MQETWTISERSGFRGVSRELERADGDPVEPRAFQTGTNSPFSEVTGSLHRLLCFLGVLIVAMFPEAIRAEPQVAEETEYYEIHGSTSAELWHQMRMQGPKGFSANTKWNTQYRFKTKAEPRGCVVTEVSVTVRIQYTMPRWANGLQASPTLQEQWHKYYECLKNHEMNHKEIAVKNARLLEQRLLGLRSSSCKTLGDQCHEVSRFFLEQTHRENDEYDRRTDHAKTEGCRLP